MTMPPRLSPYSGVVVKTLPAPPGFDPLAVRAPANWNTGLLPFASVTPFTTIGLACVPCPRIPIFQA